jgi:hypothetical protein
MPNICGDCKAKVVTMRGGKDVAHKKTSRNDRFDDQWRT